MLQIKLVLFCTVHLICGVRAGITCNNIVPGLSRLGQGIDLAKLDLFHDYTVDNVDGFGNTVIDYHCNENKTWISPYDNVTYQIPDEINAVIPLPSGVVISEVESEIEIQEVKEVMSAEVGVSGIKGMFSSSLTYKESHYTLTNTSKFVAQSKAFVSISEIYFIPPDFLNISLNKYARYFIDNKLPDRYEDDPSRYIEFLRTYGTHYFERGNFGGTLTIWFQVERYLKKVMNEQQIQLNAEATFLGILKAHGAYDGQVASVDQQFIDNSQHKERYFGGIANLFESQGYKAWWPTVAHNPWIYSGDLRPITDLVTGPKKDELIKASQAYLDYHYLDEMQTTLYTFIGKHYAGEDVALAFENQIKQQVMLTTPNHNILDQLYENITAYVITPKWFNYDTSLCASWFGDYCAPIQMTTPSFHPCQFRYQCPTGSLGFSSPFAPDWFGQVTFTVVQTHCTHPDNWIECYYYFQLNAPGSMPGWLLNVQFCAFNKQGCTKGITDFSDNSSFLDIQSCVRPNARTQPDYAFSTSGGADMCGQLYFKISTI